MGFLKISFQYILAWQTQKYWKLLLKSPGFALFGANLTQFDRLTSLVFVLNVSSYNYKTHGWRMSSMEILQPYRQIYSMFDLCLVEQSLRYIHFYFYSFIHYFTCFIDWLNSLLNSPSCVTSLQWCQIWKNWTNLGLFKVS